MAATGQSFKVLVTGRGLVEVRVVDTGAAAAPGGPNDAIQFNDGGTFGGSGSFTWSELTQSFFAQGAGAGSTFTATGFPLISLSGDASAGSNLQVSGLEDATFSGLGPGSTFQASNYQAINFPGIGPTATFQADGYGLFSFDGTGPGSSFNSQSLGDVNFGGTASGDFLATAFLSVHFPSASPSGSGLFLASGFQLHEFGGDGSLGSRFNGQSHRTVDFTELGGLGEFFRANSFTDHEFTGNGSGGDFRADNHRSFIAPGTAVVASEIDLRDYQTARFRGFGAPGSAFIIEDYNSTLLLGAEPDTTALLDLDNSAGTNGAQTSLFTGSRDPNGVVTGTAGSLYLRSNGTLYVGTGGTVWVLLSAGGGGASKIHMWASLPGQASSTVGQLQMFNVSTANPGGVLEQTSSGDPGINNGGSNPFVLPACTLTKATLTKAKAAVAQGTTGGAMTARFDLYEAAYSSRSLLTSLDFPVASAGVNNNLGGNNFEKGITLSPSVAITEGAPIGLQFTNRGANNNEINAIGGCYVYLEFTLP